VSRWKHEYFFCAVIGVTCELPRVAPQKGGEYGSDEGNLTIEVAGRQCANGTGQGGFRFAEMCDRGPATVGVLVQDAAARHLRRCGTLGRGRVRREIMDLSWSARVCATVVDWLLFNGITCHPERSEQIRVNLYGPSKCPVVRRPYQGICAEATVASRRKRVRLPRKVQLSLLNSRPLTAARWGKGGAAVDHRNNRANSVPPGVHEAGNPPQRLFGAATSARRRRWRAQPNAEVVRGAIDRSGVKRRERAERTTEEPAAATFSR